MLVQDLIALHRAIYINLLHSIFSVSLYSTGFAIPLTKSLGKWDCMMCSACVIFIYDYIYIYIYNAVIIFICGCAWLALLLLLLLLTLLCHTHSYKLSPLPPFPWFFHLIWIRQFFSLVCFFSFSVPYSMKRASSMSVLNSGHEVSTIAAFSVPLPPTPR